MLDNSQCCQATKHRILSAGAREQFIAHDAVECLQRASRVKLDNVVGVCTLDMLERVVHGP